MTAAGVLALLVSGVLLGTSGTLATWTDDATVSSGSAAFSAGEIAAPRIARSAQVVGGTRCS